MPTVTGNHASNGSYSGALCRAGLTYSTSSSSTAVTIFWTPFGQIFNGYESKARLWVSRTKNGGGAWSEDAYSKPIGYGWSKWCNLSQPVIKQQSWTIPRTTKAQKITISAQYSEPIGYSYSNVSFTVTIDPLASYTYSYDIGSSQTKWYNKALTLHSAPTKTGYKFGGWKCSNGETYPAGATLTSENSNLSFKAIWTAIDVNVICHYNDGTDISKTLTGKYNGSVTLPPLSRENYAITGYNTDPGGGGTTYEVGSVYNITSTSTVNLYAQWKNTDRPPACSVMAPTRLGNTISLSVKYTPPFVGGVYLSSNDVSIYAIIDNVTNSLGIWKASELESFSLSFATNINQYVTHNGAIEFRMSGQQTVSATFIIPVGNADIDMVKHKLSNGRTKTMVGVNVVASDNSADPSVNVQGGAQIDGLICSTDSEWDSRWEQIMGTEPSEHIMSTLQQWICDIAHPVGSYYLTEEATNPHDLFGGTWVKVEGKFLLSSGAGYSVGSEGGEATHKLEIDEMPEHRHGINTSSGIINDYLGGSAASYGISSEGNAPVSGTYYGGIAYSGKSVPHNNMPPYRVVNIWRRRA